MKKEIFPSDKEILSDEDFRGFNPSRDGKKTDANDERETIGVESQSGKNDTIIDETAKKAGENASYLRDSSAGGKLHFFYSREERLKKAPRIVQDVYNGNFKLNKGFRALFANKVNRFMLITIVIGFAFIFGRPFFSSYNFSESNETNRLEAFAFESSVFVTLHLPYRLKAGEEITFCASDKDGRTTEEKKLDFSEQKDVFRVKFHDDGIEKISVFLQKNGREEKMECDVSR